MSKQKGTRGESKVVEWFTEHGWYAQRTGGSGAGTSDDRPDVIALRPVNEQSVCVVSEVKARNDGTVRMENDEIYQLESVAEQTGGLALVIVRPDLRSHDHMYAWETDELKSNKKSFTVTNGMLPGPSIEEKLIKCVE